MMVRVSRRFNKGLAVNFNYTLSSAMDLLDNDSDNINNPFNMRQNWAKAGYDQTNVFTTDFVYDFPKVTGALNNPAGRFALNGWEITGMFRSQSGMPITIGSNGSTMGVDSGSQYAESGRRSLCGTEQVRVAQPGRFPASGRRPVRHAPEKRSPHAGRPQRGCQPDQELRHHAKA